MSTINDLMYQDLLAKLGESPPITLNDLTYEWLGTQGYTGTLMDRWNQLFTAAGLSGSFNDMYFDWLGLQGCLQDTLNDRLMCFWGGGSPPSGPAFYALTPDPTTKQLLMQRIGSGVPTHTHTATVYAQDQDGIYQPYSANKPVWVGGRYVDEDNVFADVTPGGADIVPQPYLQYYPAAENSALWSRDWTNAAWLTTSNPVITYDQVGLTGEPNTASSVGDQNNSVFVQIYQPHSVASGTETNTAVYYVKKDTDQTRFPELHLRYAASLTGDGLALSINTQTGASAARIDTGGNSLWEVIDDGDWWKVVMSAPNTNKTDITVGSIPAASTTLGGALDNTLQGSIIVGNCSLHLNQTISQVRNIGPLFSTTASVASDATLYSFDALNDAANASWFFEGKSDTAQNVLDGFIKIITTNWTLDDGTTTVPRPWTENTIQKVGISAFGALMSINVDGVRSADVAYDGLLLQGALDLFRTGDSAGQMNELQRYDITSLAEGQSIIDTLML